MHPGMSLGEIVTAVGQQLEYEPDLLVHRTDIRHRVNRVYQRFARSQPWPWLQRRANLWTFPDFETDGFDIPPGGTGVRTLAIDEADLTGTMYPAEDLGAFDYVQSQLEGAEIELADPSLRDQGNGNWELAPFVIERVVPEVSGAVLVYLDPRANIDTFPGTEGSIAVRFPRYRLPVDLDRLIAIRDPDGDPLTALPPALERRLVNNLVVPSVPGFLLEDRGHEPRFGPLVRPGVSIGVTPVNPDQNLDIFQRENQPIRQTIAAAAAAGGSLTADTTYQVFASWWYSGRFGPPSNTVEVTTTSVNKSINVSNLPVMPSLDYGRVVALFIREGEGAFYLADFQLICTTATKSITQMPTGQEAVRPVRWGEVYPGNYQYVRLFPRPTVMSKYVVEYIAKPRQLIEDTDQPEFDQAYHELLVYMTAADFASKVGGDMQRNMLSEVNRLSKQLNAGTVPQMRYAGHQKGMIGSASGTLQPFIGPDIDWNPDNL